MFGGRFSSSTGLIGIDYGSRSIKMLQMREKSGRASVVGAARIDIDLQHLPTSVDANDIAAHDAAAALQCVHHGRAQEARAAGHGDPLAFECDHVQNLRLSPKAPFFVNSEVRVNQSPCA